MDSISKLYQLSHRLLHLGEDGSPIYANEFSQLNAEVLKMADDLFPVKGKNQEEEAALCVALLMAYNATIYNYGDREDKKQAILDRASAVVDQLPSSLLKCRLLLYCYGEIYEKELIDEARQIIISWGGRELTREEEEMMELYNDLLQNPNSL
jgi:hypothetical protein